MKNSSIENRFCMSLVAFAVIVRLLLATGAAAAAPVASSSRTITANATRLMQKRFSMLLFFICFASIQSICAGSGGQNRSF